MLSSFPRRGGNGIDTMTDETITLSDAQSLEELAALARAKIGSSRVLITRITADRQVVLAKSGASLPAAYETSMPLSHSICQHAVAMDYPLVVDDAYSHPLLKGTEAASDLEIAAYLGAPIHAETGEAIGAVCALELHQRRWSSAEIELIVDTAQVADQLITAAA